MTTKGDLACVRLEISGQLSSSDRVVELQAEVRIMEILCSHVECIMRLLDLSYPPLVGHRCLLDDVEFLIVLGLKSLLHIKLKSLQQLQVPGLVRLLDRKQHWLLLGLLRLLLLDGLTLVAVLSGITQVVFVPTKALLSRMRELVVF